MVTRPLAAAFLVSVLLSGATLFAQAPRTKGASSEYVSALREAVSAFTRRDFDATIRAIDAAEAILPPTPITLNTRGAVFIERKQYAEGEAYCRKALALDSRFYPARFNLCEVPLVQKRYAVARRMFQELLNDNPKDELAKFRILLTWLLEKNDEEARKVLETIPFPSNTCAYYYGNAAWEFAHDNAAEGEKWVARGNWVFKPEMTNNFSQPFVEIGWLKAIPGRSNSLPEMRPKNTADSDAAKLELAAPLR